MAELDLETDASRYFSAAHRKPTWGLATLLIGIYLLMRLPNLRDMPVFCDEATYLRWAQLIRADPLHNLWISMQDAKLPLHYWLLALFYRVLPDPIYSGRLFSVLCGAATIPLLLALASEMRHLAASRGSAASITAARFFGPVAALLMIFSPMAALFQRMALAESLLLLEAVAIAWMSLRLARLIAMRATQWPLLLNALTLGTLWGATLLTKQNFSYLLWVLPPLAMMLHCRPGDWRKSLSRFSLLFADATCVGLLMFVPALFTPSPYGLNVRLFYKATFFPVPGTSRLELIDRNLASLLLPQSSHQFQLWPYSASFPLDGGTLYLYLTPPILLLLIVGICWLAWRRSFAALAFFGLWSLALLGPLAANGTFMASRFAFLGVIPLMLLAAWSASEAAATLRLASSIPRAALLALLLLWPAIATLARTLDYRAPILLRNDRAEYLTNASAGDAVQHATDWLSTVAVQKPITLLTGERLGIANDFTWITLRANPNIQLLATDRTRLPMAPFPQPSTLTALPEQWLIHQAATVTFPPGHPVYRIVETDLDEHGSLHLAVAASIISPYARIEKIFLNPPLTPGACSSSGLAVLRIDAPQATPMARMP